MKLSWYDLAHFSTVVIDSCVPVIFLRATQMHSFIFAPMRLFKHCNFVFSATDKCCKYHSPNAFLQIFILSLRLLQDQIVYVVRF